MKKLLFVVAIYLFSIEAYSQTPCLETWHYRVPITLDNTTNSSALIDYQVKFVLNTDSLIKSGILKADASDLRFTNAAGVLLPFWIVNNTLNTTNTEIWVNVDNIPPLSKIDIFAFYGKLDANSVESGDATFLHYDNFDGSALDFGKWNFCGGASGGTIPVVSAGEITFSSSSGQYNHSIKSSQNFSGPITTEMKVNSANIGVGFLGQVNSSNDGYGMALENVSFVDAMRLVSTDASSSCLQLNDQSPVSSVNSGSVRGLWSFSWSKPNQQLFSWPNGSETRTDFIDSTGFGVNKKNVLIGSFNNTGSISVDYVYTRKYSPIVPSYSYGVATELVDYVDASSNSPVCVGDSLKLYAPTFAGAVYNWVGPNGYTSTSQNPVFPVSDFSLVGKYVVTVSAPTNCSPVIDSVRVVLDSVPVAGILLSDTFVCYGDNQVTLRLKSKTGSVIYWESSNTLEGPWNTITNLSDSLPIENLVSTQYYRALVSFGACGVDTSNISTINVDSKTEGGYIVGTRDACYGDNQGTLKLIDHVGTLVNWESSSDKGATWNVIATTKNQISYTDLVDTTWYRVLVKNGVCDSAFSDTSIIFVQPLPVVEFSSKDECLGYPNVFVNSSTVTTGFIDRYEWRLGDSTSSSHQSPVYTYSNHGVFEVYLKAISDKGCVDSLKQDIVVNPLPEVSFAQNDVCDTSTMNFINSSTIATGSVATNYWNYGETTDFDTTLNGSNLYGTYGAYSVTLYAVSDSGCVDSANKVVRVLQRAVVDFTLDSVCLKKSVQFVNTTNTHEDSTVYSWNFGDGLFSSLTSPKHEYKQADTFQVVLQTTTFEKCINTKIDTVIIYPLPKTRYNFANECQYDSVKFMNTSTIKWGTMSYNWSFGDSVTSTLTSPSHLYAVASNYFVNLMTTSDHGCVTDTTLMTEVYPIPTANYVFGNVCRDTLTPLTNTSTIISGTMTNFWDFADGNTSVSHQPTHTFAADGTYPIKLRVTSNLGCLDSVTKNITIHPIPNTFFTHDSVCNGYITHLVNRTTINKGYINSYNWNLGDTTFSANTHVDRLYAYSGKKSVSLRAISDKGCQKDTTIEIAVHPYPRVGFEFDNECVYDEFLFINTSRLDYGTMTHSWKFGDSSFSILTSPTHTYERHGFYPVQLISTTDQGCQDSLVKIVEVYPLPLVDAGIDTSVSYGFWHTLEGIAPTAEIAAWSPGSTVKDVTKLVTEARPLIYTTYTLTVTDQYGCKNSDEVNIFVNEDFKLLVSNVVTPNGDGKNDTWKIYNASSFEVVHIQVYDRWGTEVFKVDNYTKEWDGNVNLDNLTEGTYQYLIYFDQTNKNYKGSVTILR